MPYFLSELKRLSSCVHKMLTLICLPSWEPWCIHYDMQTTPILFTSFTMLYTCNSLVLLDLLTCALNFRGVGFKQYVVILLWPLPFRWQVLWTQHVDRPWSTQSVRLWLCFCLQHINLSIQTLDSASSITWHWHHPLTMKCPQFEWTDNRYWTFPTYSWIFPCYNYIFLEYLSICGNSL